MAHELSRRVPTNIPGLDEVLLGGLLRNKLYLVLGDPGTGKTTIALQYLLGCRDRGERCLYISLSETRADLDTVARAHGWDLSGIEVCDLANSEDTLKADYQYTVFHPAEVELGETTKTILAEVERVNPSHVVFDGLSEVRLLARDPLRYRRQMLSLKQYFADKQMTVVLLDDRATPLGDVQPESVVTGVIVLEHIAPGYGRTRRRLQVTKVRGSNMSAGFHDYDIRDAGVVVFPRLVAAEHHAQFQEGDLVSGITGLDTMLMGGLEWGTTTLVMGPAGVGKSTVSLQYVTSALRRGVRAAMFSFDEITAMLLRRAENVCPEYRTYIESGAMRVAQVDPAELSPGAFASEVRHAVDTGARVIVIDSLNGYINSMSDDRYLAAHLHELCAYLNQQGVITILVIAQHGLIGHGDVSTLEVSYLADTVLLMRYFETQGEVRQAISVFKKRTGPHERTLRELTITSNGILVGEPLRGFHGIMTGVPNYEADRPSLGK